MIDTQLISIIAVLVECVGIVFAERKTALLLGLATILTIIIFFMV